MQHWSQQGDTYCNAALGIQSWETNAHATRCYCTIRCRNRLKSVIGSLDVQNLYSRNGQMWKISTEEGKKEERRRKWWLDRIALCRNVEAWCQLSDYYRNTLCFKTLKWESHGKYWVFTSETEVVQGRLFTFTFLETLPTSSLLPAFSGPPPCPYKSKDSLSLRILFLVPQILCPFDTCMAPLYSPGHKWNPNILSSHHMCFTCRAFVFLDQELYWMVILIAVSLFLWSCFYFTCQGTKT